MIKNFKSKKEYILIIIFFITIIIIFRGWINFGYIAGGDWRAWDIDSMKEWFNVFPAWENNEYGGYYTIEGINLIRYPIKFLYGILAQIGIGFNVSERLLNFFLFLFLAPIGIYQFNYYFFKNKFASVISSAYFILNVYIFDYCYVTNKCSMIVPIALIPWILLYYIKNLTNDWKIKNSLILILVFNMSLFYDIRITYLTIIILIIYSIFFIFRDEKVFSNIKIFVKRNLLFVILTLLLNLFWILPMLFYPTNIVEPEYFDILSIRENVRILDSFFNTYAFFKNYTNYFTSMIVPILVFVGLFFKSKYDYIHRVNMKIYLYFTLLFFIFLSAGITSPLHNIFEFFFVRIPGFNAYRSTEKFTIIVAFVFSIILSYFFSNEKIYKFFKRLRYRVIFFIFFLLLLIFNLNHYGVLSDYQPMETSLYSEEISTFKSYPINKEMKELKDYFNDKKRISIMFFPSDPSYSIVNKNLTGIYTPDTNFMWPYLKSIFEWRYFSESSDWVSFLASNQPGLGNLSSLIGINYFYLLPENDLWWRGTKDLEYNLKLIKDAFKNLDGFEKIRIGKGNFIYKNKYNSDRVVCYDKKNIKYISSIEDIYSDNFEGISLNENIYFNSLFTEELKILLENFESKNNLEEEREVIIKGNFSKSKEDLILKNVKKGDILELKQRYSPYWRLRYKLILWKSYETAYQTNAFIIQEDGDIEVELIFLPQMVVSIGFYIWLSVWSLVIVALFCLIFIYKKN